MAVTDELATQDAVHDALGQAGLQGREHLSVRALSQGQRRRVNLARLLLQKRALWVLDEPLTALDAKASQWVIEAIDRHLDKGGMVVLTTHQDLALAHPMQLNREIGRAQGGTPVPTAQLVYSLVLQKTHKKVINMK